MASAFKTIGLIGKAQHDGSKHTLSKLHQWLVAQGLKVIVEQQSALQLEISPINAASLNQIGERCDLAIVVGGDGRMLGAARVLSLYDIAVIGVNRGNLGFLTDLDPDNFEQQLLEVLQGDYLTEKRFLLEAKVLRHNAVKSHNSAMNEVVLHLDKVATMLEFEVYIDDQFMLSERADGFIIATPTGSTAYSMSAGGPIVFPSLDTIVMVPMFPHTLSSRPIVLDSARTVTLKLSHNNTENMSISCDSHVSLPVLPGDEIVIQRQAQPLRMVHPKDHDYFEILRSKLGWGSKLF